MKYLTLAILLSVLAISCKNTETKADQAVESEPVADYVLFEVEIEGMTCTGCEQTVESGVTKVDGVGSIDANHVDGNAQIKFVEGKTDTSAIKQVIEASGYKVISFKKLTDPE